MAFFSIGSGSRQSTLSRIAQVAKSSWPMLFLAVAVVIMTHGTWNASLPFGDEGGHIGGALQATRNGGFAANPYQLCYQAILRFVTADPVLAHYLFRSLCSMTSVFLLYAWLCGFKPRGSNVATLAVCLIWLRCSVNMPRCQFGNINIFSLNLAMLAAITAGRGTSIRRLALALLVLYIGFLTRPEYILPLCIVSTAAIWKGLSGWRLNRKAPSISAIDLLIVAFSLVVVVLFSTLPGENHDGRRDWDRYLRLGLNQCSAFLYVQCNPEVSLSPMQEYRLITDKMYGPSDRFSDALRYNPYGVLNYLVLNGLNNIILLAPSLLEHHPYLSFLRSNKVRHIETAVLLVLALAGTVTSLWPFWHQWKRGFASRCRKTFSSGLCLGVLRSIDWITATFWENGLLVPLALATASVVALLLLIPDTRYWVSCVPIIMLWMAWSFSGLLKYLPDRLWEIGVLILLSLFVVRPLISAEESGGNNLAVRSMRAFHEKKKTEDLPVISGAVQAGVFAFGLDYRAVDHQSFDPSIVIRQTADFLLIDPSLRDSKKWSDCLQFWQSFEARPDHWGYVLLYGAGNGGGLRVYAASETPVAWRQGTEQPTR